MADALTIPRAVLDAVVAHARKEYPNECCGLLAGSGIRVTRHFPLVNELASPTAYRSEPRSMLNAIKAMRRDGLELVAIYHSHPTSDPVPSRRDVAENEYGETIYLIVGLANAEPVVQAWRMTPTGTVGVELVVEE
jgi:proteasome lid subunit RPN8/RPN11